MTKKLKPGPSDPVPQSGQRHGSANRRKLPRHVKAAIALFGAALVDIRAGDYEEARWKIENANLHGGRADVRVKAETDD
jgi:hypothetical protein